METKIALFKSEINSELSLPTNVIQTISIDNEGNIYFFTSCKGCFAKNIDQPFYAYLDYHKKGYENRLRISGKAMIVKDENTFEVEESEMGNSLVLIKLKIMQAEFFAQPGAHQHLSWPQKIKSTFNHLFFPAEEQHFKFG